ncbi:MAG: 6-hydroxy-D-nicotine oxidase, partial [Calditrichaeota bacterium]
MEQTVAEPSLRVTLLGHFDMIYETQSVSAIKTARMRSLLAYLLLNRGKCLSRQHLAFLFWPDSSERQARTNLRQLLHHVHRAFPEIERFLHADTKTLEWKNEIPFQLDVAEFEKALEQAGEAGRRNDPSAMLAALEQAASFYQADLLPECYEEWIESERERLRRKYIEALERLVQLLEKQRAYPKAIEYALRLLHADDLNESSYH